MDARITKSRLGNLLAYDWLKILATIVAAIVLLSLLFTMTGTRPSLAQSFYVYAYQDLKTGKDFTALSQTLERKNVFSYDVLKISSESFQDKNYGSMTFSARRSAGEGTVMLLSDEKTHATPVTDENGRPVLNEDGSQKTEDRSELYLFAYGGAVYDDSVQYGTVYDTVYYFAECEEYLAKFYGENWEDTNATPDETVVRETFLARNGKDKRFRKQAQKEEGIREEYARIESLQEDYLFVREQLKEGGALSHVGYPVVREGVETTTYLGISLKGLSRIGDLVYFETEEGKKSDGVTLSILCQKHKGAADMRFETVSFLRFLVEEYSEGTH